MQLEEGHVRLGREEEDVVVDREAPDSEERERDGLLLGGESPDHALELRGLDEGRGEEGDVGAGFDLDELSADLAASEHVPGLEDLVLERGIEVQLDRIAL